MHLSTGLRATVALDRLHTRSSKTPLPWSAEGQRERADHPRKVMYTCQASPRCSLISTDLIAGGERELGTSTHLGDARRRAEPCGHIHWPLSDPPQGAGRAPTTGSGAWHRSALIKAINSRTAANGDDDHKQAAPTPRAWSTSQNDSFETNGGEGVRNIGVSLDFRKYQNRPHSFNDYRPFLHFMLLDASQKPSTSHL